LQGKSPYSPSGAGRLQGLDLNRDVNAAYADALGGYV